MATRQGSFGQLLREYGLIVLRKMAFIAIGWVLVYFISQPFRHGMLMLGAPLIGALFGLIAGWYMAERAVDQSNLSGLLLWTILVIGAVAPIWIVEGIMHLCLPTWTMDFGGWMCAMTATLLALAAAVWHASSQE